MSQQKYESQQTTDTQSALEEVALDQVSGGNPALIAVGLGILSSAAWDAAKWAAPKIAREIKRGFNEGTRFSHR